MPHPQPFVKQLESPEGFGKEQLLPNGEKFEIEKVRGFEEEMIITLCIGMGEGWSSSSFTGITSAQIDVEDVEMRVVS
jgi:hypothetical protein